MDKDFGHAGVARAEDQQYDICGRQSLADDSVDVWLLQLDHPEPPIEFLRALLSPDEQARASRFHFESHRNRFIAGRGLLRLILARYLDMDPRQIEFTYGPHGKPALVNDLAKTDLQFNLAHSENVALIAVSRVAAVGVDIERIRPVPEMNELVARFFSTREHAAFEQLLEQQKPAAFFNLWTRKEAWLKATGDGIAHFLNRVEVAFLPGEPARLVNLPVNVEKREPWSLHDLGLDSGFVGALAIAAENPHVSILNERGRTIRDFRSTAVPERGRSLVSGTNCSPPITIMGVTFDGVTTSQALDMIEEMISSRQPHYLVTANVDFLVQAQVDVELRRILFDAHLVLCDGTPVLWASRLLGNRLPERVAGADLAPLLLQRAAQRGYRVFFLGASPISANRAIKNLQEQHPDLIIAGHYSPVFAQLLEMDHEEIKRRIIAASPDLLLVSFGCPKQEKWMAMHYRSLGVPVVIGVGATIDFLAGRLRRAPRWMRRTGLEWLFRLLQEPRRLFARYARDLSVFGKGLLRQWWRLRSINQLGLRFTPEPNPGEWLAGVDFLKVPNGFDIQTARNRLVPTSPPPTNRHCVMAMNQVSRIDSTGLGLLVRWHKTSAAGNRKLLLLQPSQQVEQALELSGLRSFFTIVRDLAAARALLKSWNGQARAAAETFVVKATTAEQLSWPEEVTAVNAERVWLTTRDYLIWAAEASHAEVHIELSSVRFIDSSGLALMLRATKLAQRHGTKLVFIGPQPAVLNVIRLARLQGFLLGEHRGFDAHRRRYDRRGRHRSASDGRSWTPKPPSPPWEQKAREGRLGIGREK